MRQSVVCATKLGIVVHYHEPECCVCNQTWYCGALSRARVLCVQPNLALWCIIMSQSVVWQFWIGVLKVKVTVRVQILREYIICSDKSSEPLDLS